VLYPVNQADILPKITAPVARFNANRGDHVRAGQVLALLENRDLVAASAAAKAQVEQADANLRQTSGATIPVQVVTAQTDVNAAKQQLDAAQTVLESRKKLFQEGALAKKLVDDQQVAVAQAQAQYQSAQEHLRTLQSVGKQEQIRGAQAQVDAARAQYQSAQAQVAYSEVRSPISGVVADRPLYEGNVAQPGTPLFTIVDVSSIVARANVPQLQAMQVRAGQDATIRLTDGSLELPGKVTVVSPSTDPASTTVQVWVRAANPGERLKPGLSARVTIVTAVLKNATLVPASAILPSEEGGAIVATVGADNVIHKKKVELGVREPDKAQILSGVSPGDQVVTVGGLGLDDNSKVRIVKPGEEEEAPEPGPEPAEPAPGRKK
jgi:multidrug efflux pump subunit AcrA (membrane-fusion protein)